MPVALRHATPADRALLERWDEAPHVLASDPNDDWGWEAELARDPDWREQLVAEADGRPISFVQIIDPAREDSHYWGSVEPNLRVIDPLASNTRAIRFYERLGFRFVERRRFNDDDCCVYRVDRAGRKPVPESQPGR